MIFKGAFHAHTIHSYDGKVSLPDLCAELKRRGYHFLLLTEHDDTLDAAKYEQIRSECAALSSAAFRVVPGFEVRCWRTEHEQWHIAAIGAEIWIERGPIEDVVRRIAEARGLSVFLHPFKYSRGIPPDAVMNFDAVEIWNGKEDGRFAPKWKTLQFGRAIAKARAGTARPALMCGHDLHALEEIAPFALETELESLQWESLRTALQTGKFSNQTRWMKFSAVDGPSGLQRLRMLLERGVFAIYKRIVRVPGLGRLAQALRRWKGEP